jgi:ABC-type antimicrobial peptide transport system permease subunit
MFRNVPSSALLLSVLGLIPFYGFGLVIWAILLGQGEAITEAASAWMGFLLSAQLIYVALVASFLGAIHWGLAMANIGWERQIRADPERWDDGGQGTPQYEPAIRQMLYSIAPCLFAWAIVVLFQWFFIAWAAVLMMMVLLAAIWVGDRNAVRYNLAPPWFTVLRGPMTILAEIGLFISFLATF